MRKFKTILLGAVIILLGFSLYSIQCKSPKKEFNGKCYSPSELR